MLDAYAGDVPLLRELGLRTDNFERDWTDLGTVTFPYEGNDGRSNTTVKVEVSLMPAQFWRFTVTRPPDTVEHGPDEVLVVSTGSGAFSEYWPGVKHVADHCFEIEETTTAVAEGWWHPNVKGGQVHDHGPRIVQSMHRLCGQVYSHR